VTSDKKKLSEFWEKREEDKPGLSTACGCYVFAISGGKGGLVPWYVGMTENRTFKKECFDYHKTNHFNHAMRSRQGTPHLFLIPKMTETDRFQKPTQNKSQEIEFLENYLFILGLKRNKHLKNEKGTKHLREIIVPGILNTEQGTTNTTSKKLKKLFGI
jgi:hypothetical protein